MSILGAALAGGAQGAQNYFDNRNLELREQAERAFQMRLLDRAEAREDLQHERAVEQDYINYQRDTLNNDIAMAREDARYKDTHADTERSFKLEEAKYQGSRADAERNYELEKERNTILSQKQSATGGGEVNKFYRDYLKEVSEVRNKEAEGTIDEQKAKELILKIQEQYAPVLGFETTTPKALPGSEDYNIQSGSEKESKPSRNDADLLIEELNNTKLGGLLNTYGGARDKRALDNLKEQMRDISGIRQKLKGEDFTRWATEALRIARTSGDSQLVNTLESQLRNTPE